MSLKKMKLFHNLFVKLSLRVIFSNWWHNVAILQVKEKVRRSVQLQLTAGEQVLEDLLLKAFNFYLNRDKTITGQLIS